MSFSDDIRRAYDSILDWRNSEDMWRKQTVEEFARDQGFVWCDDCEYFVLWNGRGVCPSCRFIEEEAT